MKRLLILLLLVPTISLGGGEMPVFESYNDAIYLGTLVWFSDSAFLTEADITPANMIVFSDGNKDFIKIGVDYIWVDPDVELQGAAEEFLEYLKTTGVCGE